MRVCVFFSLMIFEIINFVRKFYLGTHPEQLHIMRELSKRKERRLELATKKREYEIEHAVKKRKMDEYATWSWWKVCSRVPLGTFFWVLGTVADPYCPVVYCVAACAG